MHVIGFSSGVVGRESNVDRMVKAVLTRTGGKTEYVKLTDLTYSGCKGCVDLCAKPQVCLLEDDLKPYYQKIKEADAVVLGSPIYMSDINAMMVSFIERFFGYRHVDVAIQGKPFIVIACGHRKSRSIDEKIEKRMGTYKVNMVDIIEYSSKAPPCLSCGRHRECSIGGLYGTLGEKAHAVEVTEEMFCRWEDDPIAVRRADEAVLKLEIAMASDKE
jgi:multimeric flavodoxin WrbA